MNGMMIVSAALAGAAMWLWPGDGGAGRLKRAQDDGDRTAPSATLLLEMLAVSIRQGASIPRALDAVGTAWGGECGGLMIRTAAALHRGAGWPNAWALACGDERFGPLMMLVADTLEPSWRHGSSPLPHIEAAAEQIDKDSRRRIEEAAAKLGVRMLVPTGLCFLPSFILIGIVPAIASFGFELFG
ncbi:type II secretion system F family protein [Bifidobacterium vespertilionis]|uniref:Pilus assembly protein n=1 Tax=Bifidobacterium vespertilionis TaxID=2562524 RepID=A0A5J5E100_9BIFI|nr:type II secretion system F family protein [Bifidobacterium vespertilionis]KAA8820963.1 pilus assembly protein [Bifidobacterium vespertilionis]KAA8822785.1 pilus assembly protein [Bifidobacterium vespertilionis]